MTLEHTIELYEITAEDDEKIVDRHRKMVEVGIAPPNNPLMRSIEKRFGERAERYRQLASWLKALKSIKEIWKENGWMGCRTDRELLEETLKDDSFNVIVDNLYRMQLEFDKVTDILLNIEEEVVTSNDESKNLDGTSCKAYIDDLG